MNCENRWGFVKGPKPKGHETSELRRGRRTSRGGIKGELTHSCSRTTVETKKKKQTELGGWKERNRAVLGKEGGKTHGTRKISVAKDCYPLTDLFKHERLYGETKRCMT